MKYLPKSPSQTYTNEKRKENQLFSKIIHGILAARVRSIEIARYYNTYNIILKLEMYTRLGPGRVSVDGRCDAIDHFHHNEFDPSHRRPGKLKNLFISK